MKYVNLRRDRESPFLNVNKLAPLQFTGLVMVFKRLSEVSEVTISVVKCPRNFLGSNICTEYDRK